MFDWALYWESFQLGLISVGLMVVIAALLVTRETKRVKRFRRK